MLIRQALHVCLTFFIAVRVFVSFAITKTFHQSGRSISILAGGTGITPQTTSSRGVRPASDSYAAVFEHGAATAQSTAQVTVAAQTGSKLRPYGSAGLLERPDMTAPSGSPRASH